MEAELVGSHAFVASRMDGLNSAVTQGPVRDEGLGEKALSSH
jgi:hypothetical protein